LIPEKDDAVMITNFRSISISHAISKYIAKMMASRLVPHMDYLVSNAQSAFIKKRSIHKNYMYEKNLAWKFHCTKTPCLIFKLNIKKNFLLR
jgi:hypothetical protein